MAIHLRSAEELEKMHRAGLIVHEVLAALRAAVKPGVSTMDLEKLAEQKLTLGDFPPGVYDHNTQTREFRDGEKVPLMAPSTMFDQEAS